MEFASILKELRKSHGLSQMALAKQTGISLRTVQTEINAINGQLGSGPQYIDHGKNGYIAQGFSGRSWKKYHD